MASKSYIFILRTTVDASFDILVENLSGSQYLIPEIIILDGDIQSKTLEFTSKLFGQDNVELLSCIGFNDESRAYLIRVLGAQSVIAKSNENQSLIFIPLERDLETSVQLDVKHYFRALIDYVSDNLYWD